MRISKALARLATNFKDTELAFDLGIRSEQGTCDLCFMKGAGKLKQLIREDPERAEWWIEQERQSTTWRPKEPLRNAFQAHFSKRYTYEDLREEALNLRQKSLFDEEEPEPSCFCD